MENIDKFDLKREMKDNMKVKKEYSIAGKLTKWNGNIATGEGEIEIIIVDDTKKLLKCITNMQVNEGRKLFDIDGIMTYISGNSHDEDYITEYYIFGSNNLWGKIIDVERDLYTETNVHCFGSKSLKSVNEAVKYFVSFQNEHFIISPVIISNADIMKTTKIQPDIIEIYGENDEQIENFARILGINNNI